MTSTTRRTGNGSEAVVGNYLMPVHRDNHEQHNIRHVTVSNTTQHPLLSASIECLATCQNVASRRAQLHGRTIGPTMRDENAPTGKAPQWNDKYGSC